MGTALLITVLALLGLAGLVATRRMGQVRTAAELALADGEVGPVVEVIDGLPAGARPNAYNLAVRTIWDSHRRGLAIELIRAMGERLSGEWIAQYWIRQALEVEPQLARETFGERFMDSFYKPRIAQQCGTFG